MTGFTRESAERIARATKTVERMVRNDGSHRGRYVKSNRFRMEAGKLDADLAYGSSAAVSVWRWNGSAMADAGYNVTAYDWLLSSGQTISSGTQVIIARIAGRWLVIGAQCA
jgi:hypothetical protein